MSFRVRKRILAFFFILAMPAICPAGIYKITIDAPIHPITSEYIVQTIDLAERENAKLLLMTLNTPGGLDTSMREIIEKIVNSKVPVAAYVSPSGARSASAAR